MPSGTTLQPVQHSFLSPPFDQAQVVDAMRLGLFSCPPGTPLREVARMMATYRIHTVVVSELGAAHDEPSAWGIVSDLDLARSAKDMARLTAGSVASSDVITIGADETLERAAGLMVEHDTAHLIVVRGRARQPVGMLSTLDLAAVLGWGQT